MQPNDLIKISLQIEALFENMQVRVMQDIVRRILKAGKITSTADYQIEKIILLGNSTEFIEAEIKRLTGKMQEQIWQMYEDVIDWEYVRNKGIYEQINGHFIPYEDNEQLQQWANAIYEQTNNEIKNITRSMGFALNYAGRVVFTPFSEYYQKYLDRACMDVVTGVFDYNMVLRRVVKELTASGIRTVDYASGYSNRVTVAGRRAVMTGVNQLSAKINEKVAKDLGTDTFEVTWHAGARPTHWWGGMVFTKKELENICGLGSVDGLCGANCRHNYMAFVPGVSVRTYTDEQLAEMNRQERQKKEWNDKKYTTYEATQKQRKMETSMRAQRERIKLLQDGKADKDTIMLEKAKYQGQLNEYARFCKKMGLPQERERIYLDGLGKVATNTKWQNMKYTSEMIRNARKDSKQYEKYKEVLGNSVGTLADFRQMKYNEPREFEVLTDYKNSVENGMISPLSGLKNYKKMYEEIEKNIVGLKTSNGIKISGQSKHFIERVIGTKEDPKTGRPRSGVEIGNLRDALLHGDVRVRKRDPDSVKFVTDKCIVSVNPNTGILIQCNPQ